LHHLNIQANEGQLIKKVQLPESILEVREHNQYRWLASKDAKHAPLIFQSLINLNNPTELVFPYTRTMTLFLLWKESHVELLNLGMGIGSIETALSHHENIKFTSVEQSKEIVDIAKKHFELPNKVTLNIETATQFLSKNTLLFDVILCDLFNSQNHSNCIFKPDFYKKLKLKLHASGVIFLNLLPKDADQLQQILLLIRQVFNHVALVEYPDHKNIMLIVSAKKIPNNLQLLDANNKHQHIFDFTNIIHSMIYLPVKISNS